MNIMQSTMGIAANTLAKNRYQNIIEEEDVVMVQRWVDYRDKYGIGYKMTNGTYGAVFNDQTIAYTSEDGKFQYKDNRVSHANLTGIYNSTDYPKPLHKKYTLLKRFRAYINQLNDQTDPSNFPSYLSPLPFLPITTQQE